MPTMFGNSKESMAQFWETLANRFRELSDDEERRSLPALKAFTVLNPDLNREVSDWRLDSSSLFEEAQAEYENLGRLGSRGLSVALASPFVPLQYWLDRLFQYLCETKKSNAISQFVFVSENSKDHQELATINRLNRASIAFCYFLQQRTSESPICQKPIRELLSSWVDDNFISIPPTWSWNVTDREWVSLITQSATTPIPIEFTSARLNVLGRFNKSGTQGSPRHALEQVAKKHGLVWGVTENGLWMAADPPSGIAYASSNGSIIQPEARGPGKGRPLSKLRIEAREARRADRGITFDGFLTYLDNRHLPDDSRYVSHHEQASSSHGRKKLRLAFDREKP